MRKLVILLIASMLPALAGAADKCNQPAAEPVVAVSVPSQPFAAIPSLDGCTIFVTMPQSKSVAVMSRTGGVVRLERTIDVHEGPTGAVLTHDGALLIAAAQDGAVVLDTTRGSFVGHIKAPPSGARIGSVYVNITADDRTLFISDEYAQRITVIDFAKARTSKFHDSAVIGTIPTGFLPIALTFSPDEHYLYTTSEAAGDWGWPKVCVAEGAKSQEHFPEGALLVIDVARARTDPAHAVIAKMPAGCSAVRLALSPGGDRAYVTARNANAMLAFDTAKLLGDPEHALIGRVPVGSSPVGVAVVDDGKKIVVANSNRFAGGANDHSTLSVIDAASLTVLGTIPAGAFPREMRLTADGRTLLVTNFASKNLQIIDVSRMPITK